MDGEHDDDREVFGEHDFASQVDWAGERRPGGDAGRRGWSLLGKVVAVALILGGLGLIGYLVLFFIALNNFGSNK